MDNNNTAKSDNKTSTKQTRFCLKDPARIPAGIVFFSFLGCMLPDTWGKAFAAVTAMLVVLKWFIPRMSGKLRYLLLAVCPLLTCLLIRHFSGILWEWLGKVGVENAFGQVLHYAQRLADTGIGLYSAFAGFLKTREFSHLSVLGSNIQFVLLLLAIPVCWYSAFRHGGRPAR